MADVTLGKLGKLLDPSDKARDAIHIAVVPVVAAHKLMPGDVIGFVQKGDFESVGGSHEPIGIVDPFLLGHVKKGQRFYMFLFPQTITSLRHEWTHPAFGDSTSKDWIKNFAEEIGTSYNALMEAAADWIQYDTYFIEGGKFEGIGVPAEFWPHYEVVTGESVDEDKKQTFFSCAC